jgi:hypothetical protein
MVNLPYRSRRVCRNRNQEKEKESLRYSAFAGAKIPLLPQEGDKTPPFIFSLFICICHSKVFLFLKYFQEDFDKEYIGIDSYLNFFGDNLCF